uniref:Uncharacterized protein n=1 Tax=Lepeophtheirus salmonis TaxID=72036 RepID=A0A0K2SY64_LEPSM
MMDGGDAVTSGGGKSRGGGGGAHDSDLLDDSILRETENPFLDVLLSGFQRKPEKKNYHFKFDELARTECMIAKQNLINVCKSSRYCQNSDSMRLSVEEMCTEYDELIEMSYHAAEQLLMIVSVFCFCFVLYMILLAIEKITVHFFGTKNEGQGDY